MKQPTQEEINDAIKSCKWRKSLGGTDVCLGNCNICLLEVQAGRCDTLQQLFGNKAKEE